MGIFNNLFGRNEPALGLPDHSAVNDANEAHDRLDSLLNVLSGVGSDADPGAAARPNIEHNRLSEAELRSLYRYNGYAQRIVDIFADEATRKGWTVVDPNSTEDVMGEEDERLGTVKKFQNAVRLARLMGGALVMPILEERKNPDAPGNQLLRTPLKLENIVRVKDIVVFEKEEFKAHTWGDDLNKERYREPILYTVGSYGNAGVMVHHSRVMYIPGVEITPRERFENGGIDDSVLQACWDSVRNLTSIEQGGASLGQRLALNVMKVSGLKSIEPGKQGAFFRARMKMIASGLSMLNMVVLGESDEFDVRASPVSGYRDLSDSAKSALAAASSIPLAILFGEAPGGLNADGQSHREAFNNAIAAYQKEVLLDQLRQFYTILYSAKQGPTRGAIPDGWYIEFNPLDEMSEIQSATLRQTNAQTDALYMQWGVLDAEQVEKSRFGPDGYSNEIVSDIEGEDDMDLSAILKRAIETGVDPMREDAIEDVDTQPTKEMAENAARGLRLREEHGRGGTAVGVARARDVMNRERLSPETVQRMKSFFARHEVDKKGKGFYPDQEGYPSAGLIAWLLWGGDAGQQWAEKKAKQLERAREKAK